MSSEYDPALMDALDVLDLESHGWIVLDDSDAHIGDIVIGATSTPGRRVRISADDENAGSYYYSLEVFRDPNPPDYDFLNGYAQIETGYDVTIDELAAAVIRHLDPEQKPDTRFEKDRRILALLKKLDLEGRGWVVSDSWKADLSAIGIGSKDNPYHRVWVSTYEKAPGRYDYDCEKPTGPEPTEYEVVDEARSVSFETLVKAMERHLG